MGTAAKKKRPMRSRRSGVKKLELVKANLSTLKKLAALFIIVLFAACTPAQYVYVDPQDSVVRKQRIIYDYQYIPLHFTPIIIQRWSTPRYQPQRWIPQRPTYRFTPPRQLPPRPSRRN
jgi:hypothetical protein